MHSPDRNKEMEGRGEWGESGELVERLGLQGNFQGLFQGCLEG